MIRGKDFPSMHIYIMDLNEKRYLPQAVLYSLRQGLSQTQSLPGWLVSLSACSGEPLPLPSDMCYSGLSHSPGTLPEFQGSGSSSHICPANALTTEKFFQPQTVLLLAPLCGHSAVSRAGYSCCSLGTDQLWLDWSASVLIVPSDIRGLKVQTIKRCD